MLPEAPQSQYYQIWCNRSIPWKVEKILQKYQIRRNYSRKKYIYTKCNRISIIIMEKTRVNWDKMRNLRAQRFFVYKKRKITKKVIRRLIRYILLYSVCLKKKNVQWLLPWIFWGIKPVSMHKIFPGIWQLKALFLYQIHFNYITLFHTFASDQLCVEFAHSA